MPPTSLPRIPLGPTGPLVTRVGLGGEGVLRTRGRTAEAHAVIEEALDAGITYFDSARAYDDSERYHGGVWSQRPADRDRVFLTSKSAERAAAPARRQLTETLARLKTDHLDLWQIHDLRAMSELDAIEAPGGALEAFLEAKREGRVRHIGVTGHHDPAVLTEAIRRWPLDTVLLPANPMEGALGGFLTDTLQAARARGLGVIGMKVLGGSGSPGAVGAGRLVREGYSPEALLAYALAQPVDVVIVGCSSPEEVRALAQAAEAPPMSTDAQADLVARMAPRVARLASYRGTFG